MLISDANGGFLLEIYELILNDSKFTLNLDNFRLHFAYYEPKIDVQTLLTSLPSSMKHLDIRIYERPSPTRYKRSMAGLIQSQTQLLSLRLNLVTSDILDAFK